MIKRWLALPLKETELQIEKRTDVVQYILNNPDFISVLEENIKQIGDLERLISKVSTTRVSPRECNQLKQSLNAIDPIKEACKETNSSELKIIEEQLNPCKSIADKIKNTITENPPAVVNKGNVIKEGINPELDELRNLSKSGKDYLQQILERESEKDWNSILKNIIQ